MLPCKTEEGEMLVKKYSNRRLYDTDASRYVTIEELGAKAACLTGSGSAVFGIFPRRADANRAAASFGSEGEQVFVARFLMRVPRAEATGRKRRAMGGRQAR